MSLISAAVTVSKLHCIPDWSRLFHSSEIDQSGIKISTSLLFPSTLADGVKEVT